MFVIDCGIAVTPDDLESALDLDEPLFLSHFLAHLHKSYNNEVSIRFPNILVRVLDQCARKDVRYDSGSWLVPLDKYLLDNFDIDINFIDSSLGSALQN